jgi:hypothetical protein
VERVRNTTASDRQLQAGDSTIDYGSQLRTILAASR